MIPTVSEATHEKPGCRPSLIDNLFVNSTGNVLSSGILEYKVSHHSPIFCFMDYYITPSIGEEIKCPKYDYCESKVSNFLLKLGDSDLIDSYVYDVESFTKFVDNLKK